MNELKKHYKTMLSKYTGGLSNTSTTKFDDIVDFFSNKFGIPKNDIYATGSGTRPGNLEVRLSQGVRATIHTVLGLGFIKDDKNSIENRNKLANSALVTVEKFLGRGKASYDNIAIFIESENDLFPMGLIYKKDDDLVEKLKSEFAFEITKQIEQTNSQDEKDVHLLERTIADFVTRHDKEEIDFDGIVGRYQDFRDNKAYSTRVTESNIFGILYATQISNGSYKAKGVGSIAHAVLGENEGSMGDEINRGVAIGLELRKHLVQSHLSHVSRYDSFSQDESYNKYLRALRTKPFMLLAGISGTGKSRIVRELAFKSCPEDMRDKDATTPGNYLMIEVKPNWHDSTEILGYYSNIAKKYQYTKFIRFAVKATLHPEVPFFVCLDEMNLAPVEQYFAEFLSVLETRKKVGDKVNTGILVEAKHMKGLKDDWNDDEELKWDDDQPLTLPDNLFVIGTVNMDDTTHQFSRKVIDRAMTIEMNGGSLESMFENRNVLEYLSDEDIWKLDSFKPQYVTADEALAAHPAESETMKKELSRRLSEINDTLAGTPFQVSYRVLNELCIYAAVLLDDGFTCDEAISEAVDKITLMKILPRIEGDEDMFSLKGDSSNKLQKLRTLFADTSDSWKKLSEMDERLTGGSGFTRFWP